MLGRQVNTGVGPFADMCTFSLHITRTFRLKIVVIGREYTKADARWGVADPTVVSLELLTVLGGGPLACYILYQLVKNDPADTTGLSFCQRPSFMEGESQDLMSRLLTTSHLLRASTSWMTFCPEWLTGSQALSTSNLLHLWVYLAVSFYILPNNAPIKAHNTLSYRS